MTVCVFYLLVWASCSSRNCLWTSHLAGWSAARAMSAVMRFRLTEPASSQTERRSKGGWPRPNGWPGPWPCPAGCSLVASLCCCCSMYCRMFTSCTTALMPSPTAWLWRLQLATRTIPVWRGRKKMEGLYTYQKSNSNNRVKWIKLLYISLLKTQSINDLCYLLWCWQHSHAPQRRGQLHPWPVGSWCTSAPLMCDSDLAGSSSERQPSFSSRNFSVVARKPSPI